jgi:gamma-glutamyltranspeptidase/glutathione hydrolase
MPRLMSLVATALCALAVAATAAPAAVPPSRHPTATGSGGAAATVDPYATRTAIEVLRSGGNAVDAALAAAAVLGVVEPYSSGLGGGGFMVVRTADGAVHALDGREFAPNAFRPTSFIDPDTGEPLNFPDAVTSGLSVGVPGTLALWQQAAQHLGTRPLGELLQPAIRLARRGFVVDPTLQQQTTDNADRFADFPATAQIYLPGGQPIQAGTVLRNPDLSRTYKLIAHRGIRAFYRGQIARDIVQAVRHPPERAGATRVVRPGLMRRSDLAAYRAKWRKPATTDFRGMRIVGMPPPSSGGSTVEEALNIMEAFGTPSSSAVEELFRYLEASRLAFADRNEYLGDPDFVHVPLRCLLSQRFADQRRALVGSMALSSPVDPGACPTGDAGQVRAQREGPNTTNLTVADRYGNVVEYTLTIEQTGGSAITVPHRGFLLNNELTDFDFTPGGPNQAGPRKRPRSSIAPTIVLRDGRPVVAVGSPGGSTIITTVLQILVDRLERGMTLPQAIADPRISQRNASNTEAEPAFLNGPLVGPLQQRGESFVLVPEPTLFPNSTAPHEIGAATGIDFLGDGRFQAAAEPVRRGGGDARVVHSH